MLNCEPLRRAGGLNASKPDQPEVGTIAKQVGLPQAKNGFIFGRHGRQHGPLAGDPSSGGANRRAFQAVGAGETPAPLPEQLRGL